MLEHLCFMSPNGALATQLPLHCPFLLPSRSGSTSKVFPWTYEALKVSALQQVSSASLKNR
uniref:Uncharacterized protein n=1 Tax=Brassica oleracea TaxID=3712 RepID=A0A3P6FTJ4_BRAOL|nr:unnamed protein product [Brassica oleracea]